MKPIKVFYHVIDIENWSTVTDEQVQKLETSGLLDAADTVYFNLHYKESSFAELKNRLKCYKNIEWVFNNNIKQDFEHSTAVLYQQIAKESKSFNALYFHQKGLTHIGTPKGINTMYWRQMMDYWNIERWEHCNNTLLAHDCVGCNFSSDAGFPPHFSGTTRWMTSSYIRQMPQLVLPSSINYQPQLLDNDFPNRSFMGYRMEVEFQIGAWANRLQTRFCSVYQPPFNYSGYEDPISPKLYR